MFANYLAIIWLFISLFVCFFFLIVYRCITEGLHLSPGYVFGKLSFLLSIFYCLFFIYFFYFSGANRPVVFGISLPCSLQENKENARPNESSDDDSSGDGPILYRDDNLDSKFA